VWLAHYTSSGIEGILNMEARLARRMLKASMHVYEETVKAESWITQCVVMVDKKEE
jgi:hypothetical protein